MIEVEKLLKLDLSKKAKEIKYRSMFQKCTSMNLLASYSISIDDLIDIMGSNKDDEGLEEMTEIIKKSEVSQDGQMDYQEFRNFMNSLYFYKHTIIIKAAISLKKVVTMSWSDEKE